MIGKLHGIVDCDYFLYSAGFAAARTSYQALVHGEFVHDEKYMKDMKLYVAALVDQDGEPMKGVTIEKTVNPMPLSHSLNNLKTMVEGALQDSGCDTYKLYLSQGKTFRDSILGNAEYVYSGKNKFYKGNRVDVEKPKWYEEMVDYLMDNYDVRICLGIEADDAVAIQHTKYNQLGLASILISADKDLNTVPGLHYNPQKRIIYTVDEDAADEFFWCQMIMGDTADNITGLPRHGAKAAIKILSDCVGHEERRKAVMCAYFDHYKDLEFSKVQGIINDNLNLLWMMREYIKDDNGNIQLRF